MNIKIIVIATLALLHSASMLHAAGSIRTPISTGIDKKEWCVCVQDKGCPCEGYGDNKKEIKKSEKY